MLIALTVAKPNTGVLQSLVALLREVRNTVIAIVDPWNNLMQSPCVTFVFSPWHVCLFMLKLLLLPNKTSKGKTYHCFAPSLCLCCVYFCFIMNTKTCFLFVFLVSVLHILSLLGAKSIYKYWTGLVVWTCFCLDMSTS